MKHLNQIFCTLLLTVAIVVFPVTLNAVELIDQSSNVFKFQQKLADNGNVQAQYKLALMYEVGEGVVSSLDKALYWYDRAAKSGLKKAERLSAHRDLPFAGGFEQVYVGFCAAGQRQQ